jgi:hypothetical protein
VKVSLAIMMVPARAGPVLIATMNSTDPLPLPLAPFVTVTHGALLVAVHVHPLAVDTDTGAPEPPAAGTLALVGLIE